MQGRFQLQRRLRNYAKRRVSKLGLSLTPSSNTLIERMINHGIERMHGQGVAEHEEQILLAEQNLSHYLTKLSQKAQIKRTYPMINAKVFDEVFNESCPIWPYC